MAHGSLQPRKSTGGRLWKLKKEIEKEIGVRSCINGKWGQVLHYDIDSEQAQAAV